MRDRFDYWYIKLCMLLGEMLMLNFVAVSTFGYYEFIVYQNDLTWIHKVKPFFVLSHIMSVQHNISIYHMLNIFFLSKLTIPWKICTFLE